MRRLGWPIKRRRPSIVAPKKERAPIGAGKKRPKRSPTEPGGKLISVVAKRDE